MQWSGTGRSAEEAVAGSDVPPDRADAGRTGRHGRWEKAGWASAGISRCTYVARVPWRVPVLGIQRGKVDDLGVGQTIARRGRCWQRREEKDTRPRASAGMREKSLAAEHVHEKTWRWDKDHGHERW
jgi:hypothetical protein